MTLLDLYQLDDFRQFYRIPGAIPGAFSTGRCTCPDLSQGHFRDAHTTIHRQRMTAGRRPVSALRAGGFWRPSAATHGPPMGKCDQEPSGHSARTLDAFKTI